MVDAHKIAVLKEMIDSAEASLRQAKICLSDLSDGDFSHSSPPVRRVGSSSGGVDSDKIVEGAFDGERMHVEDGSDYPVPANYASKSKLVPGDVLKLTILDDGRFVYKQIGPVPRKQIIGTLVNDNGKFRVLVGKNAYKVLLASVTYFRAEVGDRVTLVVPDGVQSEWGAIEAVLPADSAELDVNDHILDDDGDEDGEEESLDFGL